MVESVYCAVRTDSLCKADYVSSLKGYYVTDCRIIGDTNDKQWYRNTNFVYRVAKRKLAFRLCLSVSKQEPTCGDGPYKYQQNNAFPCPHRHGVSRLLVLQWNRSTFRISLLVAGIMKLHKPGCSVFSSCTFHSETGNVRIT